MTSTKVYKRRPKYPSILFEGELTKEFLEFIRQHITSNYYIRIRTIDLKKDSCEDKLTITEVALVDRDKNFRDLRIFNGNYLVVEGKALLTMSPMTYEQEYEPAE